MDVKNFVINVWASIATQSQKPDVNKVNSKKHSNRLPLEPLNLSRARCGERLKIVSLKSNSPSSQRLRELGFCEMSEVCKVSDNGALICKLLGCRVAIARDLGSEILVEPVCK